MHVRSFINTLFLCHFNVSFMIAGIFLNSGVIISLWRSSQLRKKLCYFMILVLSCFDLAVVTITHPLQILSTVSWFLEDHNELREQVRTGTSFFLNGFSMLALLTLNIERFLALAHPFRHHSSITKKRLVYLIAFFMTFPATLLPLLFEKQDTLGHVLLTVGLSIVLFLFVYLNYKMFIIAKSKHRVETVASNAASDHGREARICELNLKNVSTCSLAVVCFIFCSSPHVIYSVLRWTTKTSLYDKQILLFNLWTTTLLPMNSTFNCLIFFWRNSILRREGMKIVKYSDKHCNILT